MTDEELAHLNQLRRITRERLRELEKQAARYGNAVPAHVRLDIKSADEELRRIEAKMKIGAISPIIQEATGPEAGLDVLRVEVRELGDKLSTALRWMTAEIIEMREHARQMQAESKEWRRGAAYYRKLSWIAIGTFGAVALGFMLLLAYQLGAGR